MKRKIFITDDGSTSLKLLNVDEQYHSGFGAIQEAQYVYLLKGLEFWLSQAKVPSQISILEIGFGTGLNAFLSYLNLKAATIKVDYVGVEAFPLNAEEVKQLNYVDELKAQDFKNIFKAFHTIKSLESKPITENFKLTIDSSDIKNFNTTQKFDLIYFDAFGPDIQPELWTEAVFKNMYSVLNTNAVLVTYSAKGAVRRTLKAVGFEVERLEGPPGKRHMLRAIKKG